MRSSYSLSAPSPLPVDNFLMAASFRLADVMGICEKSGSLWQSSNVRSLALTYVAIAP